MAGDYDYPVYDAGGRVTKYEDGGKVGLKKGRRGPMEGDYMPKSELRSLLKGNKKSKHVPLPSRHGDVGKHVPLPSRHGDVAKYVPLKGKKKK